MTVFKACVCYFLTNFYFSSNDSPSKTMKDAFYFISKTFVILEIFKFLYSHLPLLSVSHCFWAWSKISLEVYDVINCLNKNLIYFVWYLEKEKFDIKTLSIDRVLNKKHFYGKSCRKYAPKASPRPPFLCK